MEQWVQNNWDYLLFAVVMIGLLVAMKSWMCQHLTSIKLNRSILGHLPSVIMGITGIMLISGWYVTDHAEHHNLQLARFSTLGMLGVFFVLLYAIYVIVFFVSIEMVVRKHQAEIKANEEVIKHQAYHDALTGLPNRTLFQQRLTTALEQAHRNGKSVGVMFLDLDRFKHVNDTFGHSVGDLLLQAVAQQLRLSVREADTVARVGGDEFVILLPELGKEEAVIKVAEKVLHGFRQPFLLEGHELYIGPSIGISLYPNDSQDAEGLIKNADTAMYRAKERGNVYQLYTSAMNTKAMERLSLESSLRKAIERGELLLHYQPQIHLRTGKMVGAEALVRWQHPQLGLLSPEKFIPLAEETGLILPLGDWVLRNACRQMVEWQEQGLKGVRVSVNISAKQFQKADLVQSILRILEETGLDPHLLELELTESCIMQSPETAADMLFQLKQLGVKLSIDDFGSGYSSLSHLKNFPIDVLKISQFFIWDLPSETDDQAIVTTMIALAHSLQLKVVAEGVETQEQLAFLNNQHCDEIQGFFFSPPVPPEELPALYKEVYGRYAEQDFEDFSI